MSDWIRSRDHQVSLKMFLWSLGLGSHQGQPETCFERRKKEEWVHVNVYMHGQGSLWPYTWTHSSFFFFRPFPLEASTAGIIHTSHSRPAPASDTSLPLLPSGWVSYHFTNVRFWHCSRCFGFCYTYPFFTFDFSPCPCCLEASPIAWCYHQHASLKSHH